MAAEKPTIIIKKIKKGGHGHHGGAWKVAYADFVTAMMAFFLVMWLLGADEEVKSEISHYFNNPATPWRKDMTNKDMTPMGDRTGAGESMLKGLGGSMPEDVVERPTIAYLHPAEKQADISDEQTDYLAGASAAMDLNVQLLRFSIPENVLFQEGSDQFTDRGERYMKRFGKLVKGYSGKITVEAHLTPEPKEDYLTELYEFTMTRVVAISDFLVAGHYVDDTKVTPQVSKRKPASSTGKQRFVDITLQRD